MCTIKVVISGRPIYQSFSWVSPEQKDAKTIINYIKEILTAINFDYGPSHVEVFLTSEGPRLVEVNPRISGASGFHNKMCKLVTGRDQADLLADLYAYGELEIEKYTPKIKHLFAKVICLCNVNNPGPLNMAALNKIKAATSFQEVHLPVKELYPETTDMHSLVGFVLLANTDEDKLEQDYQMIIGIQDEELFKCTASSEALSRAKVNRRVNSELC